MGDEQLVRVEIDTMEERFPVVGIRRGLEGRTEYEVPADLLATYEAARRQVDQAERAVLQYVADHYPGAEAVREELS